MRVKLALLFLSSGFTGAARGLAEHKTPVDARGRLDALSAATSLDGEGLRPWHLKMNFQMYDLFGQPKETGTVEEWWVSPTERRLVVTSPSYNETIPAADDSPRPYQRDGYLIQELLSQVVHPIPHFGSFEQLDATESKHTFGKVTLTCLKVQHTAGPRAVNSYAQDPEFCMQPDSDLLRARFDSGGFCIVRNKLATFQGIHTALDQSLSYGANVAITGHIDALETFDPAKTPVAVEHTKPKADPVPGVVLAGKVIKKVTPIYPEAAKAQHISGSVVLCAVISKEGTIRSLDVVASANPLLSQASLDAVKQWVYSPYLLNGQPTEVQTTVTVNFNIGY